MTTPEPAAPPKVVATAPVPTPTPKTPTLNVAEVEGPSITVDLAITGEQARNLIQSIAVRCWLDHVIGGAVILYEESTGKMIMVSDDANLLATEFTSQTPSGSRLQLKGPALEDLETRVRVLETLEIAVETGETSCSA